MQLRLQRFGIRLYGIRKFLLRFLLTRGKRIEIGEHSFLYFVHRFAQIRFKRIDILARRFEPRKLIRQIFFIRTELRIDRIERIGLLLFALFRHLVNRFGDRFVKVRKFRFRLRTEFFDPFIDEPNLFRKFGLRVIGLFLSFVAGCAQLFDRIFGIAYRIVRAAGNFDKRFGKRSFERVDFILHLPLIFFETFTRNCREFFERSLFLFVGGGNGVRKEVVVPRLDIFHFRFEHRTQSFKALCVSGNVLRNKIGRRLRFRKRCRKIFFDFFDLRSVFRAERIDAFIDVGCNRSFFFVICRRDRCRLFFKQRSFFFV